MAEREPTFVTTETCITAYLPYLEAETITVQMFPDDYMGEWDAHAVIEIPRDTLTTTVHEFPVDARVVDGLRNQPYESMPEEDQLRTCQYLFELVVRFL